ncbi:MAG: hypothetical protein HKN77_04980, partial [Woeseiaceae bacterium]|nr:hypothetical protein [Woeseiaceae bacterium]
MSKWGFAAFAVLMWVLPAFVAGALGWPGVWGGGSAFGDLILPAPITGGFFHLPTFIAALIVVKAYPSLPERAAVIARAVLIAALLIGLLQLIDLEGLVQAITTDRRGRALRMEENYFGLFMTCDSLVALFWVMRRRLEQQNWLLTSTIVVVPIAAFLMSDFSGLGRVTEPFQFGRQGHGLERGDSELWIYARMKPDAAGFQQAARAFVDQFDPRERSNTDDLAVFFSDSLDTVKNNPDGDVFRTLCLYDDGTPDEWHEGKGDCFSNHDSFTDRFRRRTNTLFEKVPTDVAMYVIFTEFCDGVEIVDRSYYGDSHLEFCHGKDLDEKRAELVEKYGEAKLVELLESISDPSAPAVSSEQ